MTDGSAPRASAASIPSKIRCLPLVVLGRWISLDAKALRKRTSMVEGEDVQLTAVTQIHEIRLAALVGIDTTIDDRTQRIGYGVCQVSSTLLAYRHHIARLLPQDSSPETAFSGRTEVRCATGTIRGQGARRRPPGGSRRSA